MSTPPTWPPPPPMPPGVPGAPRYAPAPRSKKPSAVAVVAIVIAVIFGGIFVVGMIAAIAIPSLLRARTSANEAAALGALRTMESAQATWAKRHDGHFVQPDCLTEPPACGDAEMSSLLPADVALLHPHSGYDFGFALRPGADQATGDVSANPPAAIQETPGVSPPGAPSDADVQKQLEQISTPDTGGTVTTGPTGPTSPPTRPQAPVPDRWPPAPADHGGFAYWATPSNPGVTGFHRFCIDETGLVRAYTLDDPWTRPSGDRPRCPETRRRIE
jgi:hypothetical protein